MVQPLNLEGGLLYSITLDLRVVGVKVSDLLAQPSKETKIITKCHQFCSALEKISRTNVLKTNVM